MISFLKKPLWRMVDFLARPIRDERTGEIIGRAILWPLGKHPKLIGLHHPYVRALFLPEDRIRYGRHRLAFATHEPVNYHRVRPAASGSASSRILWSILVHHSAEVCKTFRDRWVSLGYAEEDLLFVHGGSHEDFEGLTVTNKVFVTDPALRTSSHPPQKQSYSGVLKEISHWLRDRDFGYIAFVEYDHLPEDGSWGIHLKSYLEKEQADVLFHRLVRVDGTNAPHYLYHLDDKRFLPYWQQNSVREDRGVVLNCLATGSFWKKEALEAVCAETEPFPIYLEMFLPTKAHHLGFRVRDIVEQNQFVSSDPLPESLSQEASRLGAWARHPIKPRLTKN